MVASVPERTPLLVLFPVSAERLGFVSFSFIVGDKVSLTKPILGKRVASPTLRIPSTYPQQPPPHLGTSWTGLLALLTVEIRWHPWYLIADSTPLASVWREHLVISCPSTE